MCVSVYVCIDLIYIYLFLFLYLYISCMYIYIRFGFVACVFLTQTYLNFYKIFAILQSIFLIYIFLLFSIKIGVFVFVFHFSFLVFVFVYFVFLICCHFCIMHHTWQRLIDWLMNMRMLQYNAKKIHELHSHH